MIEHRTISHGEQTLTVSLRADKYEIQLYDQIFGQQPFSLSRLKRGPQLQRFYELALAQGWKPLIVDLGANIGLSAAYFSLMWPQATVVAVEPEAANFEQLMVNARERPQIVPLHRAASNRHEMVAIANPDTDPVGFQTRRCEGEGIQTVTVPELLQKFSWRDGYLPFILKVDIEGYESALFDGQCDWIDEFALMITELHDWALPTQGTSRNFLRALAERERDFIYIGENVFSIAYRLNVPVR